MSGSIEELEKGGTLVDLCCRLENISVSEVVKKFNNDSFSFRSISIPTETDNTMHYKVLSKELLKRKKIMRLFGEKEQLDCQ